MECTFVMIKPDGYKKNILKNVIEIFLSNGLSIGNVNITTLDEMIVSEHYNHLVNMPFYPELQEYILSGPVVTMNVFGENAINKVRDLVGATDPKKALPGTIRYIYGTDKMKNCLHASDSKENADLELKRFRTFNEKKRVRK